MGTARGLHRSTFSVVIDPSLQDATSATSEMAGPMMPAQPNPQKRLQLFFDGTANSAAEGRWADATNVFRVVLALH
jgi:hypothetical protein